MPPYINLVKLDHPEVDPVIARQAAELILEIGNYKETRDVQMVLGKMAGRTTVAALDDYEQVIGTAGLRIVSPNLGSVEDVVSDPRKRGLGIGRKVIETVETVAISQGVLELNLASSLQAVTFYEHLGYQRLGESIFRKFL